MLTEAQKRHALASIIHWYLEGETGRITQEAANKGLLSKDKRRNNKRSLLALLMNLPGDDNEKATKLTKFLQHPEQAAHKETIRLAQAYFTPRLPEILLSAAAPAYIRVAVRELFFGAHAFDPVTRYSPTGIINFIEEHDEKHVDKIDDFAGIWHVIRYSSDGTRVLRLALRVRKQETLHWRFRIYYRTFDMMAVEKPRPLLQTRGSLILLRGGDHVLFAGQEESRERNGNPEGYPLFITASTLQAKRLPFLGLVQRRDADAQVFAIRAAFHPADEPDIDDLRDKIGSWDENIAIEEIKPDIPDILTVLQRLVRPESDNRKCGISL